MTEFELKFEIPVHCLQQVAAAMHAGKASRQRLRACYFDTEDDALAGQGLVVRVRKEGRRWVQTAKGPTGAPLERLEHNVNIHGPAAGGGPAVDLARHIGTPVGGAMLRALNLKTGESFPDLIALYETDIQRVKQTVTVDGSVVEVALDRGLIVSGSRSLSLCELEVELKQGKSEHALGLARHWCGKYGLWLSAITKSMKGQRLRRGQPFGPAVSALAPEFGRYVGGQRIANAVLRACLHQILPNASEVASGSSDPEHIHQLRVGLRRLRTALRELAHLATGFDASWQAPLVAVFRGLGQHRDASHLARILQPRIEAAGGPPLDAGRTGDDIADPGALVRSPAFQDVLLSLIGFAHRAEPNAAADQGGLTPREARKAVRGRLGKLHALVLRDGRKFLSLDATRQHRVRKRLKRLHYLVGFSAPLFPARKTSAFVSALKPAQDALGLYNDETVALQTCRTMASDDPRAWFGVGWLSARQLPNATLCQHELNAFAKARAFWQ